jgi:Zn-finger nucleic acid-binding protein
VRLVACPNCHTQYDVSQVVDAEITCRCGEKIQNRALEGVDAKIHRCGSCGAQVGAEAPSCEYCGSEIVRDTRRLSLICPECYARNAEESRYCTACGVAFRPEQLEIEGHELPCPACGCLMPPRAVGGIGINECPQCNGIWAPENRFDHLIAQACETARQAGPDLPGHKKPRASGANPFSSKVVYRKCPVCDAHMQRTNFQKRSGVIIDRCHDHGTWLDADELEQIAGFVLEGGLGAGGHRAYAMRAELDAMKRREAAAMARAIKGESIAVHARDHEPGGFLGILLKTLLD